MKLHMSRTSGLNTVTSYGADFVMVNDKRYEKSMIMLPEQLVESWSVESFDSLIPEHFDIIAALKPEIVLLGTGKQLRFPPHSMTLSLMKARIGLEVMDTYAACRTYNILMAEGRNVAAALILP